MLCEIGVLILIDKDELEPFLILLANLLVIFEENPSVEQEVIKVHGIGLLASLSIGTIYIHHLSHAFRTVAHEIMRVALIVGGQQESVLGNADTRGDRRWLVLFVIQFHLADNAPD